METWKTYEQVAIKVISDLRAELGVASVESKQQLKGTSGTTWEIDARAVAEADRGFLVVEMRRHTKAGLSQEQLGGIAYRIQDLGASGGIVVSPLPLQKGASLVAAHENVQHIVLDPNSSPEHYLAEFMGRTFHGLSITESVPVTDHVEVRIVHGENRDT